MRLWRPGSPCRQVSGGPYSVHRSQPCYDAHSAYFPIIGSSMQKFLLGAIIGGIVGLVIGTVFAAVSLLVPGNLVEHAARTIVLCGGVMGFVGMFIGAVSGATFAIGGGQVKVCVAAVSLGFAAGALGARHLIGTEAGGNQLLYAAAGAFGAASFVAWRGWRKVRRDSAPPGAQPWQRWFQFRLSTLMALFVATCALLAVLVSQPVMQRRAVAAIQRGGWVAYEIAPPSWLSFLLGDVSGADESVMQVHLYGKTNDDSTLGWLKALPDVRYVSVNGPSFTDAGLGSLRHLQRLESLELPTTAITGIGLKSLHGLKHLRLLVLAESQASDTGLAGLVGLTGLENLDLANTKVSDAGLEHLRGLGKLQYLQLGGTEITNTGLHHLEALKGLRWLDLHDTNISDSGLSHLAGLAELLSLNLSGTQVTDAGLKHLRDLPKLKALLLASTAVSDAGLTDLEELPELVWVRVVGTQVTPAGEERILAMTLRNETAK